VLDEAPVQVLDAAFLHCFIAEVLDGLEPRSHHRLRQVTGGAHPGIGRDAVVVSLQLSGFSSGLLVRDELSSRLLHLRQEIAVSYTSGFRYLGSLLDLTELDQLVSTCSMAVLHSLKIVLKL